MSGKTVAAFLAGAIAASSGTAAALTMGHVFRLNEGDEASYGRVVCQARYVGQYSAFDCIGAPRRYEVVYGPTEISLFRGTKQVFSLTP